jgi:hypothetical protein
MRPNIRRLMASAPTITVGAAAPPAELAERPARPPAFEREGSPQLDACGPDMERRNVQQLHESLGFQERDAALRRLHPGPSDWVAVAARTAAHYERATAVGRRRAAARKAAI